MHVKAVHPKSPGLDTRQHLEILLAPEGNYFIFFLSDNQPSLSSSGVIASFLDLPGGIMIVTEPNNQLGEWDLHGVDIKVKTGQAIVASGEGLEKVAVGLSTGFRYVFPR